MREILLGSNDFGDFFVGGVEPVFAPHTVYQYSGGGYTVAEHILDLQVAGSFADYVDDQILDAAGMTRSTLAKASATMTDLARGCSRSSCDYDLMQTNVKAAGGLLANVREYAELVTALYHDGVTDGGRRVFEASDLDLLLTPSSHEASSFDACSAPGTTRMTYITIGGRRYPYLVETCVAGKWRVPLGDGGWYGLGLSLSTNVLADGYPRTVSHGGSQTGAKTKFELDRQTGDGFVVMVNGVDEWVDGDGFTFGSSAILEEIHQAYHAAY